MPNKILWQPVGLYQPGFDFSVLLDRDLASLMLEIELSPAKKDGMNRLGCETLGRLNYANHSPFEFFGNSCFVTQISLGRVGIWLAVDRTNGRNPLEIYKNDPIIYSSHNSDTSRDANALMSLFDLWIEYSDILRGN